MKNAGVLQIVIMIALVIGLLTGLYMIAGCTIFKEKADVEPAMLEFDSFDGGGPEYNAEIEDSSIAKISKEKKYDKPDHDEIDGAGFKVIYTITGKKPGKTRLTISCTMRGDKEGDRVYLVTVAKNNKVTVEPVEEQAE